MSLKIKKNIKYILPAILLFLILPKSTANSQEESNKNNSIKIDGDAEPTSLADIPLPKFDYDIDSFDTGFKPGKELISLLDRPEDLTGMKEQDFAQEFPIEK
ncbi:hypothetical protein [Silvanigrella sp.]|jgi:hypothetical protein|uniref:hypothetical protein n=1 Tax=Silvanigrella sp. TaxID=2024976 RepID=UPI0037CB1BE1